MMEGSVKKSDKAKNSKTVLQKYGELTLINHKNLQQEENKSPTKTAKISKRSKNDSPKK